MKSQRNAIVTYHWRPLANNSQFTRYFYHSMHKYLNNTLSFPEVCLLLILKWTHILPLHLYISVEYFGSRSRTLRFYGISDGNAVPTDGSLIGRNNTKSIRSFGACTPGSWSIKFRGSTALNWQSSGVSLKDINAASKRLKLTESDPQIAYEKVSDLLNNPNNCIVSHSEIVALNEAQLDAIDVLLKRCQPHFHYKLVGNNCQNFAHDMVRMIKQTTFKPYWVPQFIHNN